MRKEVQTILLADGIETLIAPSVSEDTPAERKETFLLPMHRKRLLP